MGTDREAGGGPSPTSTPRCFPSAPPPRGGPKVRLVPPLPSSPPSKWLRCCCWCYCCCWRGGSPPPPCPCHTRPGRGGGGPAAIGLPRRCHRPPPRLGGGAPRTPFRGAAGETAAPTCPGAAAGATAPTTPARAPPPGGSCCRSRAGQGPPDPTDPLPPRPPRRPLELPRPPVTTSDLP